MIYCDLDGVLADFDLSYYQLRGVWPRNQKRPELWYDIETIKDYWLNLPLMPDAHVLLDELNKHSFKILTGVPRIGTQKAIKEKKLWVEKMLGKDIPVITLFSDEKTNYCFGKEDILIDDWEENIIRWKNAGGTAIFYQNAQDTIAVLNEILAQLYR